MALWKHSSSFGGIYGQVLVASSFGGIYGQVLVALYGQVWWHLRSFGGFLRTSLVVSVCVWYQFNYRHKNHPKKYQWWSCHASLVVNGQKSGCYWMGGIETEAEVCTKPSVVFRLQQEAGLQAAVAGLEVPLCQDISNVQGHERCQFE